MISIFILQPTVTSLKSLKRTRFVDDLVTPHMDLFGNFVICIVLSEVIVMGKVISRLRIEKLRNKSLGGNKTGTFCRHLLQLL